MAETKNKKGQSKKTNASGSGGAKKKKPTKKELEQIRIEEEMYALEQKAKRKQITAIALFFISVLLFVISAVSGGYGSVYNKLHEIHIGLWGFSAYIFPIITIIFAYFLSLDRENSRPYGPYIWSIVLLCVGMSMIHVISCGNLDKLSFFDQIAYEFTEHQTMGGVVGAFFGGLLYLLCKSKALCAVLYIILIILIAVILSKTTIQRMVDFIGKPVKKIGEITGDAVLRKKEKTDTLAEQEEKTEEEIIRERQKNFKKSAADIDNSDEFVDFSTPEKKAPLRKANRHIFVMPEEGVQTKPEQESVNSDSEAQAGDKDNQDEFASMFATIDAMEKAAKIETVPIEPSAAEQISDSADKEKIKLTDEEFNTAKSEIENEIAEIAETVVVPEYKLPPAECLTMPQNEKYTLDRNELKANADKLIDALNSFKVEAKVVDIVPGPSVTRYELQPAAGVKISKFTNLADDLALHLAAPAGVRIEAPIPNKSAIGIEVPNRDRVSVYMRELIESDDFRNSKSKLNVALGKDITGSGVFLDIAKMPHLLVAGTTGSGKSVCLNSMIVSILYNAKPSEVKLLLVDPKSVEFSVYNGIPHLLVPVVSDARKAAGALGWAVTEMINRYKILNDNGVRDIYAYNSLCEEKTELEKLPQIVIVIDELSDLMSVAPSEVEDSITRLAQMARAAGMHLVVATQRPSVDVITGLIKANIPSRIALSVSSQIDSRTILDSQGAEKLLGNGDMLVAPVGKRKPVRVQGCYISDDEIKRVVDFVKTQEQGQYDENIQEEIDRQAVIEKKKGGDKSGNNVGSLNGNDELLMKAIELVVNNPECCSISALQRKLGLGFSKAGRLMDTLEEQGIVGQQEGSKGRKVLLSKAEWLQMQALSTDDGTDILASEN